VIEAVVDDGVTGAGHGATRVAAAGALDPLALLAERRETGP
jgi:hypothetical protein